LAAVVVVEQFDGGKISSDSDGFLRREVEPRTPILKRLAGCFADHRDPDQNEHTVESLIKPGVIGLALGYEDLNDHEALRRIPYWHCCDVADPTGQDRRRAQDKGCALAGKNTLNRLELTPAVADAEPAATRKLSCVLTQWMSCWWIFFWRPTTRRLPRSFWMWMRRMIPCTGIRKGYSFTGTIAVIAICPSISSAVST
jgi:hypothetical protein